MKLWTIYACPEHGPESINPTYGWCEKYVGPGNGRPRGYITTDQWCHRDAEWITVRVVSAAWAVCPMRHDVQTCEDGSS